jgi:alpha-beta hydrolase superfamily lysophospholipase
VNESDDEVTMPADAIEVAQVKGIERGYQVFGEGEPLILLHGGFGTMEMFGPNLQLLAAGRQVIGADLQSHGRSPAADRPMRFEIMADDIAALIRGFGLERAAIMPRPGLDRVQSPGLAPGDDRRHGRDAPRHRRAATADPDLRGLPAGPTRSSSSACSAAASATPAGTAPA